MSCAFSAFSARHSCPFAFIRGSSPLPRLPIKKLNRKSTVCANLSFMPNQPAFQQKKDPSATFVDRLVRILLIACGVVVAGGLIWQAVLLLRANAPTPTASQVAAPITDDSIDDPIAAAVRALDALATIEQNEPHKTTPLLAPPPPQLSRQEAKKSAENVRRVAADAKDELKDLGLAETEDAGLVARDWLTAETAFSIGSWEAAESSYYQIINRIRQLREIVRISRELDASESAVAAALAAEHKLLKQFGGDHLKEVVTLAKRARSLVESDPILSAKLYQEALTKLPVAIGEARQAERREKITALIELAEHAANRGDWVAAGTASLAILKVEPQNRAAADLRRRAIRGIDELVIRYVVRLHDPTDESGRKADARQIRRGVRDADPLCLLTAALYGPTDHTLGVEPNSRESLRTSGWAGALRRAETKWPGAAFIVGRCHEEGFGVTRDLPAALKWYHLAASQNHIAAQNNLARLYHYGLDGVAQDDDKATHWYRKAAVNNSIPAQCALAGILLNSTNEATIAEAVSWYRKAAHAGSALAQCNLGLLLMTGRGVTRDEVAAASYFYQAATKGDALAQFNLGYLYMTGKGVNADDSEAVVWYRKAADQGFAAAQRNLGGMYSLGRGVKRDDKAALQWYTRAAMQGDAGAQCNLGWLYAKGVGTERDDTKAHLWLTRSAQQSNPEGLFLLGLLTFEGTGTPRDETTGRRLIKEAAALGFDQAHAWLNMDEMRQFTDVD